MKKIIVVLAMLMLLVAAGLADTVQVGDEIVFGRYEQDNNLDNGPEPIAWRVLEVEENEALLISVYALEAKPYNEVEGIASWVSSSLRAWLNDQFFMKAFTYADQISIIAKPIENWHESTTRDAVFLLDNDQAKHLFASHMERMAKGTAYAEAQGLYVSREYGPGNVHWWLRTISWESDNMASFVATSGGVMTCGGEMLGLIENPQMAVRPCIWFSLEGYHRDPRVTAYRRTARVVIVNENYVNVREKPDASSPKVGMVVPGSTYPMISRADNNWLEIQLDDGMTGFVSPKVAVQID